MMATSIMTQRFTVSFFKQRHGDSLARGSLWLHFSGISAPWYSGWLVGLLRDLEAVVGQNRFMKHRVIFFYTNHCGDQTFGGQLNACQVCHHNVTFSNCAAELLIDFWSQKCRRRFCSWREIEFPPKLNKTDILFFRANNVQGRFDAQPNLSCSAVSCSDTVT